MVTAGTLSSVKFGAQSFYSACIFASSVLMYHSCMEHSLHLAAGHALSCITPMHTTKKHSAGKDNKEDGSSAGVVASDNGSAIISHALCKLLGLIKQVRVLHHIYYIH